MEIIISLGTCASDAVPTRTSTTWQQFFQWLYQHPRSQSGLTPDEYAYLKGFPSKSPEGQRIHADKDGAYVVLADHGGNRRRLETLLASYGVALDLDVPWITADIIAVTLAGFQYYATTTYAHQPNAQRWRVFVPVARPMTLAEHYATWETLNAMFQGAADQAAKDPSRLSYLPGKCLYPQHARAFYMDGELFPPTQVAESTTEHAALPVQLVHDGPVPGWAGPADDNTLVAIASTLRMRPDERFGAPVHFAMLWSANEQWLGEKFPPDASEQGQQYSRTKADMALAGELAYFTGNDRARMHRLMLASGLARDDDDWRERKALRAVDRAMENAKQWHFMEVIKAPPPPPPDLAAAVNNVVQMVVSIDGAVLPPAPPPPDGGPAMAAPPPPPMSAIQANIINAIGAQSGINDYWSYHQTGEFIHRPTGDLHPATVLDNVIGKDARMALYSSRPVHRITWAPGFPERFQVRELDETDHNAAECWLYNRYQPPKPPTKEGDVTPWLSMIERLYPDDAEHIVNYFADAVQAPQHKCNHALVLGSGVHGIGKDTLLAPVRHALGKQNYAIIKPSDLVDSTNPWVASRMVQISESRDMGDNGFTGITRYEMYERCKDLAAAPPATLLCNDKYIRKHQVLNVMRLTITTNHGTDGLHMDPEDRRHYCAWSDAEKMDEDTASEIWDWYNAGGMDYVAHYLAHLDLDARGWNRSAAPPRTAWWHQLVEGGRPAEDDRFGTAMEKLGRPEWLTLAMVAGAGGLELAGWIGNAGNKRKVEREMDRNGYRRFPNPAEKRGRWHVEGARVAVYRRSDVRTVDLLHKFGVAPPPPK